MKNKEKLIQVLSKLFIAKPDICRSVFSGSIINEGVMTWSQVNYFITDPERLNEANEAVLYWLYSSLAQHNALKLPAVDNYFTLIEIDNVKGTIIKRTTAELPVTFPILSKLTDDNFLTVMSVQQINALKEAGLIKWKEGMQREVVMTKLSDNEFVSHIKYDDDRARAIGTAMSKGEFYPNTLRWHIVAGECDYQITNNSVILKSGYIAEIDGQHRDKGSEYALIDNPDIMLNMPIVLTIGSRAMAQNIISQDEKRAPINKDVTAVYRNTEGTNILRKILGSDELDPVFKFCDTDQGVKVGAGFIVKADFAGYIEKYYSAKSAREQDKTAKWLTEFFNVLADIRHEDFENFRKSNLITTKPEMMMVYVYISSLLREHSDWEDKLTKFISKIDFSNADILKSKPEKIVKEVGLDV